MMMIDLKFSKMKMLKRLQKLWLFLILADNFSSTLARTLAQDSVANNKWLPIRDFKSPVEFMNTSESVVRGAVVTGEQMSNIEEENKQQEQRTLCTKSIQDELAKLLQKQQQQQQQQPQPRYMAEASFLQPINVANQVLSKSRGLIDSVSDAIVGDDYDSSDNESDAEQSNGNQINRNGISSAGALKLDEDEQAEADAAAKEQEAIESNEAEAIDKSALDEQQQQQREIIQAQAENEAKAIKEQQEALLKQQKMQEQMLFMRDRSDLQANTSLMMDVSSTVNPQQMLLLRERPARLMDISFSDHIDTGLLRNSASTTNDLSVDLNDLTKTHKGTDLVSSAQHHYGSHYGSLHGHHSHYYQFAESHKKGQFDSGFKRGNKKFKISGHSSQYKSHADGHVKWKGKKGKGSHHWDYKHKGKKDNHYHYHRRRR